MISFNMVWCKAHWQTDKLTAKNLTVDRQQNKTENSGIFRCTHLTLYVAQKSRIFIEFVTLFPRVFVIKLMVFGSGFEIQLFWQSCAGDSFTIMKCQSWTASNEFLELESDVVSLFFLFSNHMGNRANSVNCKQNGMKLIHETCFIFFHGKLSYFFLLWICCCCCYLFTPRVLYKRLTQNLIIIIFMIQLEKMI